MKRPPYTRYDEGVGALDLLRIIRVIDLHQPTRDEVIGLTGWSYPRIKRAISTARLIGVRISSVPVSGGPPFYRLDHAGPFEPAALKRVFRQPWL